MPSFFSFQQGSERAQNVRYLSEASPLLGRFRAVPRPNDRPVGNGRNGGGGRASMSQGQMGLLSAEAGWRGSVHVGYGALAAAAAEELEDEDEGDDGYSEEEEEDAGGEVGCCCAGDGGRRWKRGRGRVRRWLRRLGNVWVDPKAGAIRRVVDVWWSRWGVLVVLPAFLVSALFSAFVSGKPGLVCAIKSLLEC
jgi:hypothetical protein